MTLAIFILSGTIPERKLLLIMSEIGQAMEAIILLSNEVDILSNPAELLFFRPATIVLISSGVVGDMKKDLEYEFARYFLNCSECGKFLTVLKSKLAKNKFNLLLSSIWLLGKPSDV